MRFVGAARSELGGVGNAALLQGADWQATVWVGGACHVAHHSRQVKSQHAFVLHLFERAAPQPRLLGIGLDQAQLLWRTVGQPQVIDGLLVDIEQRSGGTVLGAHIRNGGAVPNGQAVCPFAEELYISAHDLFFAQKLGQRECNVGGGDARLAAARKLHPNDVGQAHPTGATQHHVLGL